MGFVPYAPRPLAFLGVEQVNGYRLKTYTIRLPDASFDRGRFNGGWEALAAALPQPAVTEQRPGLGLAVLHQGRTADYLILCWWDNENELPIRVFVRDGDGWRAARGGESLCVWDIRVLWWEREAYVGTVLAGRENGVEEYLACVTEGYA